MEARDKLDLETAYLRGYARGRAELLEGVRTPIFVLMRDQKPEGLRARMAAALRDLVKVEVRNG